MASRIDLVLLDLGQSILDDPKANAVNGLQLRWKMYDELQDGTNRLGDSLETLNDFITEALEHVLGMLTPEGEELPGAFNDLPKRPGWHTVCAKLVIPGLDDEELRRVFGKIHAWFYYAIGEILDQIHRAVKWCYDRVIKVVALRDMKKVRHVQVALEKLNDRSIYEIQNLTENAVDMCLHESQAFDIQGQLKRCARQWINGLAFLIGRAQGDDVVQPTPETQSAFLDFVLEKLREAGDESEVGPLYEQGYCDASADLFAKRMNLVGFVVVSNMGIVKNMQDATERFFECMRITDENLTNNDSTKEVLGGLPENLQSRHVDLH